MICFLEECHARNVNHNLNSGNEFVKEKYDDVNKEISLLSLPFIGIGIF